MESLGEVNISFQVNLKKSIFFLCLNLEKKNKKNLLIFRGEKIIIVQLHNITSESVNNHFGVIYVLLSQ
jgi:hypothetical protein